MENENRESINFDNENMENQNGEAEESAKKKPRKWWKIVLIILLVLVLLMGIAAGTVFYMANHMLNKMNHVEKGLRDYIPRHMEDFEPDERAAGKEDTLEPDQVEWSDIRVMKQDPNIKNILLIGQDRRPGETGRTRSDSMIIVSINKNRKTVTMVSLMRDMYVPIPGYSDNRINAAYAFGGMTLLDDVIKGNFGVVIDGNIEVDFDGFTRAMSKIAPLDIELNSEEASYMNKLNGWNLHAGINALNADQLLAYARIRYVGNADFERTERQRRILNAAFAKARTMSAGEIYNLVDSIMPTLTTDMDNSEIMGYVTYYLANRPAIVNQGRLPVDGSFSNEIIRGMMVLVPDLRENAGKLQTYLYGRAVN